MKKTLFKMSIWMIVLAFTLPATAHETLYYSFLTHKIYLNVGLGSGYWIYDDFWEPRPYQRHMPLPGSYATWKNNHIALNRLAFAKMKAYSEARAVAPLQKSVQSPELAPTPLNSPKIQLPSNQVPY